MQAYNRQALGDSTTYYRNDLPPTSVLRTKSVDTLGGIISDNVLRHPLQPKSHAYYRINESKPSGTVQFASGSVAMRTGVQASYTNYQEFPPSWMQADSYNRALSDFWDEYRGGVDLSIDAAQVYSDQPWNLEKGITTRGNPSPKYPNVIRKAGRRLIAETSKIETHIRKGIRIPAKVWLAYSFILKPTLGTVYEAASEAFRNAQSTRLVKARGKSLLDVDFVLPNGHHVVGNHSVRTEIGAEMYCADPSVPQNAARFTSLNPLSIAWELMMFSFVVDWWWNVGGYLRSLESAVAFNSAFRSGYSTVTIRSWMGTQFELAPNYGHVKGAWRYQSLSRTALSSMPFPRRPVVRFDTGWRQAVHIAALLGNFLKPK